MSILTSVPAKVSVLERNQMVLHQITIDMVIDAEEKERLRLCVTQDKRTWRLKWEDIRQEHVR